MLSKFFQLIKSHQYELFLGSCAIFIALISYNFGQINSLKKTPISIKQKTTHNEQNGNLKANVYDATNDQQPTTNDSKNQNPKTQLQKLDTRVVASKNSDKYHYSWCSGAKRIKQENQIWFENEALAQKSGYTLAGNCKP